MERRSLDQFKFGLVAGLAVLGAIVAAEFAFGQTVVPIPQVVIEQGQTRIVSPLTKPDSAAIGTAVSSNPSVARVAVYRVKQIQVIAVAPGKTDITFFDSTSRVTYRLPVWVQAPNATGGGGVGFDRTAEQLEQIVMLPKYTRNVASPGNAPHNINSIGSSNPSVATARTDKDGEIQIYSQALGDTWINFADNGVRYQVHVWVKNSIDSTSGASGTTGKTNTNSKVKPGPGPNADPVANSNSKPKILPGRVTLDRCLVGSWTSDSVVNTFARWDNGGDGIGMTIDAQGKVDMDYTGMRPNQSGGRAARWSGTASGHISTNGKELRVVSVESSDIATNYTFSNGAPPYNGNLEGLGNVLQSVSVYSYTCTNDELTLRSNIWNSTWRRNR